MVLERAHRLVDVFGVIDELALGVMKEVDGFERLWQQLDELFEMEYDRDWWYDVEDLILD